MKSTQKLSGLCPDIGYRYTPFQWSLDDVLDWDRKKFNFQGSYKFISKTKENMCANWIGQVAESEFLTTITKKKHPMLQTLLPERRKQNSL